ncbi:hypothetical protein AURDEDRAFT_175823 [Auricularia subglabra TFB-10046 SS5]|uniref:Extracellular membrane protein CFEM domain-containing protein n=1 Tax=Auricularia subglabra (strain TFB-10046 / SS5) TaxID=717982 RepID=J0CWP0_AURST|nr:hypothetical protein AURDEDRAFT_175823 [Auricularia subglabra TFB-10046 SS5]
MSPSVTFPLLATLLARVSLAQFTDPTDVFVSIPALEALIPAAAQNACAHRCSVQSAFDVTTSCVFFQNKTAAECLCTDPPELVDIQACYKEHCPALQGQCLAVISDNGTPSTFVVSNIYV